MKIAEQRTPIIPSHLSVRTQERWMIMLGYASLVALLLAIGFASTGPGTDAADRAIAAAP